MNKAFMIFALSLSCILPAGDGGASETKDTQIQCQCWAITKSGNRCKRRARPNERYCKQHSASVSPTKPIPRCRSMTEAGTQCQEKTVDGKFYCSKHLGSK